MGSRVLINLKLNKAQNPCPDMLIAIGGGVEVLCLLVCSVLNCCECNKIIHPYQYRGCNFCSLKLLLLLGIYNCRCIKTIQNKIAQDYFFP